VCVVARGHFGFRLLVRSALTQQRHDGRVAALCGTVQRRVAKLRAPQQHNAARTAQRSGGAQPVSAPLRRGRGHSGGGGGGGGEP
jgi:hypothetical protein